MGEEEKERILSLYVVYVHKADFIWEQQQQDSSSSLLLRMLYHIDLKIRFLNLRNMKKKKENGNSLTHTKDEGKNVASRLKYLRNRHGKSLPVFFSLETSVRAFALLV